MQATKLNQDTAAKVATLTKLMEVATDAQEAYYDALREIEKFIGVDCDELGLCSSELLEYDAEGLLELAGEEWNQSK